MLSIFKIHSKHTGGHSKRDIFVEKKSGSIASTETSGTLFSSLCLQIRIVQVSVVGIISHKDRYSPRVIVVQYHVRK
jgi:hypothetical protein